MSINLLQIARRFNKQIVDAEQKFGAEYALTQKEVLFSQLRADCRMAREIKEVLIEEGIISCDEQKLSDKWAFISIRPLETAVTPLNFFLYVRQFIAKDLILAAEYVFEQVGETEEEMGKGFHVHILAKIAHSNRTPATVQKIMQAINSTNLADIPISVQIGQDRKKFLRTERDLEWTRNYMSGDKHNEVKEPGVALNPKWRETLGLEAIYYKN